MKTHPISIPMLICFAAVAACDPAQPAEAELIERATATTPMLTATTAEPVSAPVEHPIDLPLEEPAPPIAPPEASEERVPDSFEPELSTVDGLSLVRLSTTSAIEDREPVLASSSFTSAEERVYAFVEAKNETRLSRTLKVNFIGPRDEVGGGVELEIPAASPRWRTWAYTRHARSPGLWRVEVRDEEGTLVGALPFEVVAP